MLLDQKEMAGGSHEKWRERAAQNGGRVARHIPRLGGAGASLTLKGGGKSGNLILKNATRGKQCGWGTNEGKGRKSQVGRC